MTDPATAERIGLTWLRAAVEPVGAFGRRHDETIAPYGPGDENKARTEIAGVDALARALDADGVARVRAALRAIPEPSAILARARAGDPLTDVDFYELGRFVDALAALARAWDSAGGDAARRPPTLDAMHAVLASGRENGGFYLAAAFGAGLPGARSALAAAEAELDARRATIAARVREATGIDPVGDEFVVLRDVYAGPLPDGVRVVRDAPAYRTVVFDVTSSARDTALAGLARAEDEARRALAERIAGEAPVANDALQALGALDRALARVAFAQRWGSCVPALAPDRIAFDHAVFPPLAGALGERGRRYTPISLDLADVAVLTGPNMGGKSAALATAGFLCACVALGVPPPAREAALPLLDAIVWIGGEGPQERTRLLSSYAAEIVRARETLAQASPRTLVLIDEFARTTGPREGRALLIAFVEALRARGAFALVSTHFDGIAEGAHVAHLRIAGLPEGALGAVSPDDLDAALDAINLAMDYRVVDARDGTATSDALALARLLGFDATVVARAGELYDG